MTLYRSEEEKKYARISILLISVFCFGWAFTITGFVLILPGPLYMGIQATLTFFMSLCLMSFILIAGSEVYTNKNEEFWFPGEVDIALARSFQVVMAGFFAGFLIATFSGGYTKVGSICLLNIIVVIIALGGLLFSVKAYRETKRAMAGARKKNFMSTSKEEMDLIIKGILDSLGLRHTCAEEHPAPKDAMTVFRVEDSTIRIEVIGYKRRSSVTIKSKDPERIPTAYRIEDDIDREVEFRLEHVQKNI